jgi:hypothetical protein
VGVFTVGASSPVQAQGTIKTKTLSIKPRSLKDLLPTTTLSNSEDRKKIKSKDFVNYGSFEFGPDVWNREKINDSKIFPGNS